MDQSSIVLPETFHASCFTFHERKAPPATHYVRTRLSPFVVRISPKIRQRKRCRNHCLNDRELVEDRTWGDRCVPTRKESCARMLNAHRNQFALNGSLSPVSHFEE